MSNISASQTVRLAPIQNQVGTHVLNHPTASPFKVHNISFHINGQYMDDFSQGGIKQFVKQNDRKLSQDQVSTFVQSVANNAANVAGATFDLGDKELGLFKKDDIQQEHVKAGFSVETRSGVLPSKGVVFFDADKANFPLKNVEEEIKGYTSEIKTATRDVNKAEDRLENAQYLRQRLVDFLGADAPKELSQYQSQVTESETQLGTLKQEQETYQQELSGLDKNSGRAKEVTLMLRGLGQEVKSTEKTLNTSRQAITKKQGPLSFMGVGNSLSELHERNQNLAKAGSNLNEKRQVLSGLQVKLDEAQSLRERLLRGEGMPQPIAPTPPKPAEPPVTPAPVPPVDVSPLPPAKPPVAPQPPVSEPPVDVIPVMPKDPGNTIPVQPKPAQPAPPPQPTPAQPAPATPPPSGPRPGEQTIIPGNRYNPGLVEIPVTGGRPPVTTQPPVQRPVAPPQPVQQPVQAPVATPAPPVQPTPPVASPAPVSSAPSIGEGSISKLLYTVRKGDTLSSIAKSELGSWKRWPEIADLNREVIGSTNTHWIYPGQVLTLPPSELKAAQ